MSVSDFYVFLPSEVSTLPDERNTLSRYRTKLPVPFDLSGSWEVALVELMYTKSWYNFPKKDIIKFGQYEVKQDKLSYVQSPINTVADITIEIPEGNYSVEELFSMIEYSIPTTFKDKDNLIVPRIYYDKTSNLCKVKPGYYTTSPNTRIVPKIGPYLAGILGIQDEKKEFVKKLVTKDQYTGERAVDLEGGRRSIFAYTDIVTPQIVGNTLAPLLRVLPIDQNSPLGSHVSHTFNNLYYFPVSRNFITYIEITLRDITGDYIPFRHGRVVSTLHFRQK